MLEKKSTSTCSVSSTTSSEADVLLQSAPLSLNHHNQQPRLGHHHLQELPEDGELDIGKCQLNQDTPTGGGGGSGSDVEIEDEDKQKKYEKFPKSKPNSCKSFDEIIDEEDLLLRISDDSSIPIIPGLTACHSATAKNSSDADFDSAFEDGVYSGSSDDKNKNKGGGKSSGEASVGAKSKNKRKSSGSTGDKSRQQPSAQDPTTMALLRGEDIIADLRVGGGERDDHNQGESIGKFSQHHEHNHNHHPRLRSELDPHLDDYMLDEQNFEIHNEPEMALFDMEVSPANHSQHEIMPENQLINPDCDRDGCFNTFDKNGYDKSASRHTHQDHVPFPNNRRVHYDDDDEMRDGLKGGRVQLRGRGNYSDEEASISEHDVDVDQGTELDTILLAPPLDMDVSVEVELSPVEKNAPAPLEDGTKVNLNNVTLVAQETLETNAAAAAAANCPPSQLQREESDGIEVAAQINPTLALISPVGINFGRKQDGESPPQNDPTGIVSNSLTNLPQTPPDHPTTTAATTTNPGGMDENEEQEYDVVYVVPDGGWGWMVLFGSILVNILIPGTVKSFGILFVEFLEVFNATPTAAAWIPALSYWLYSSMGPFAGALATKYSHRSITIVGGLLASLGLMLSYFATSISYLYISYGIIGGLGAGLAYPIGVFMVGQYFEKRRGLANGLCTSGSALGSVLIPPLLRVLLSEYGYRGAILIMGGILLNVCIGAMFYEPVSKHMKRVLVPRDKSAPPIIKSPEEEEIDRLAGLDSQQSAASQLECRTLQKFPQRQVTSPIPSRMQAPPPMREIAASMPIAIPMPQLMNITDFRDVGINNRRGGSNSGRKATFQIGHEDDSWSYQSNDVASPLAARLVKEADNNSGNVSSPNKWSFYNPISGGIRVRGHLPGLPNLSSSSTNPNDNSSNPELETLIHSSPSGANINPNPNPGSTPSLSLISGTTQGASRGQSRLNLTAIPEDDDNDIDTNSENASHQVDWSYYSALPPAKQRLLRLSVNGGTQLVGSSGSGINAGSQSAHPSSGTLVNQGAIGGHVAGSSGLPRTLSIASNVSTSSFHYMSTIHHGSLLTAMQFDKNIPEFASTLTLKSVRHSCCPRLATVKGLLRKLTCGLCPSKSTPTTQREQDEHDARTGIITQFDPETGPIKPSPKRKSTKTEKLKKFIDFSLLKDGMYLIMLMSNSTTAVGYTNFIVLLPSYALAMGFDKSQAASLLSIVAALDFVGRIGGAALSDLQFISRRWYYIVGLFLSGVALSFLPYARTYSSLVTMCACFGLASGTYIGVTAVILADQLGAEKLGSSYGISLFLNGLLQLIGPPVCGAVYQSTGKLEPILTGLGIILIVGALMWIFAPFIERRRRIKEEERVAQAAASMNLGGGDVGGVEKGGTAQIVQNANLAMMGSRSETSLV